MIAAAVGVAFVSGELFGVSVALGAFFAGMVLSESHLSHRAAEESLPLRETFSVLFFVSVGMLFDPGILLREPVHVADVVAVIVIANPVSAFVLILALRYPLSTALVAAAGLAQIGEFFFILASLGLALGLLTTEGQTLILAGAIISIAVNPLLFRAVEPMQDWIRSRSELARALERPDDPLAELPSTVDTSRLVDHVVIIGYGRVGGRIGQALALRGIPFVVVELHREIVEELREPGVVAVTGDASPAVVNEAHIATAQMLAIATPDTLRARKILEIALTINPDIETVVRTHSDEEARLLPQAQAGRVFMGEHELAIGMTRHVLEHCEVARGHIAGAA